MPIVSFFPTGSGGSGGGGGIPLAAVTGIKTLTSAGKVYIKWTDPDNIVVGDATLATWAGTLLLRKAGSMPTSRRDGTVVLDSKTRNAYKDEYFCDSGLSDGETYYYKFFPYTTVNAYTEDTANEFTATPNAVPTGDVSSLKVTSQLNGRISLTWTDPDEIIVEDGVTLSTWASTKVVYKVGSYPASPEDGTLALNSTTRNAHQSNPLEVTGLTNGTTYYFALFPISSDGAVNTNTVGRITAVPNKTPITTVPSQNGTLAYTGSELSPSWSNFNTAQLTLGGTVKGTAVGTYSATFTPTDDYCWSDGSTEPKTVTWAISKAAGSLTLSKTAITLNANAKSATFEVTRAGDGKISVTSSNTSAVKAALNGTTVTVESVDDNNGSANVIVSVAEGTSYLAPANKTCVVTAEFVSAVLNDNTWAAIRAASDSGKASSIWAVGDAKQIKVNGTVGSTAINMDVWAFILGFNHNSAKEGSNRIHFQIGRTAQNKTDTNGICFVDSTYGNYNANQGSFTMNPAANSSNSTNSGGWNNSHMRKTVLGSANSPTSPGSKTFLAALPSDLRAVMKSCTKYSDNTGGTSNNASAVTATTDYLWLLAEFEVFGTRSYASQYEQNSQLQYDYYKAGNSRIKYRHNALTSTARWWLRSVFAGNTYFFCRVSTGGSAYNSSSGGSYGVSPGFCV